MINQESLQIVAEAHFGPGFVKPRYTDYGFARIPPTITRLLTGLGPAGLPPGILHGLPQRYDRVIVFLVDAFGWRFLEQYGEAYPALRRLLDEGVVSKLTSQFPSTTAAHVTCMHTGLPVAESGIYEWHIYEPALGRIITPLLWSFADEKTRDTLLQTGVAPEEVLPTGELYDNLRRSGVRAEIFQPAEYTPSSYTNVVTAGLDDDQIHGYRTWPEALIMLRERLLDRRSARPAYYYVYFDKIDTIGHSHGPSSAHFAAEVDHFWTSMERLFFSQFGGRVPETLVVVTADHGQIETDPSTTFYLNRELDAGLLARFLKGAQDGSLLVPAGSPRDLFLHIRADYLDEAQAYLAAALEGRAVVMRTSDMIDQGFFGTTRPSQRLLSRIADLVVLPLEGEAVWWYEPGRFVQSLWGHHGGLSPQEMEIPLMCYAL
jgi:predicted AlkP superfamily pyrophosphatase or phosphodiesterase